MCGPPPPPPQRWFNPSLEWLVRASLGYRCIEFSSVLEELQRHSRWGRQTLCMCVGGRTSRQVLQEANTHSSAWAGETDPSFLPQQPPTLRSIPSSLPFQQEASQKVSVSMGEISSCCCFFPLWGWEGSSAADAIVDNWKHVQAGT